MVTPHIKKLRIKVFFGAIIFLSVIAVDTALLLEVLRANLRAEATLAQILFARTSAIRTAEMESSLADTAEDRAKLNSYFIDPDKVASFLDSLQALQTKSGAKMTLSSVNEGETIFSEDTLPSLTVTLDAEGSWRQVFLFFEYLRSMSVKNQIDQASFSQAGVGTVVDSTGKLKSAGSPHWHGSFIVSFAKRQSL